jgi:hypothetical protein
MSSLSLRERQFAINARRQAPPTDYRVERSLTFGQLSARFIRRAALFGRLVGEAWGDE